VREAGHEGRLDEILGFRADLVPEEVVQAREVAREELLAGTLIAVPPPLEEREVVIHVMNLPCV
jgi:hypothetical protein